MEKKVSGKHSSMNGFAMMKGRVVTVVLASALLLGGGLTAQVRFFSQNDEIIEICMK